MHLRRIAHFQSEIVNLAPQIYAMENSLISNVSAKSSLSHLNRLRTLPLTYATTIIELVRRKALGEWIEDWATKLQVAFGQFTTAETERRTKVTEDVLKNNPFPIALLADTKNVDIKIMVSTGYDVLKNLSLNRADVEGGWRLGQRCVGWR